MSEDLLQTTPKRIGRYNYYRLGNTTLNQLKRSGMVPKKNYGRIGRKKPDGLIYYHRDIKAVVEYKQPTELRTEQQIEAAIGQELAVAKALCKLLIVTDSTKTFWINALNGQRITDQNGHEVTVVFHPYGACDTNTIEHLIEDIDSSLTNSNSSIRSPRLIDPTPLAKRLWQSIWVATGKSPVKCLYNVVELFIFKFLSDLGILPEDIAFGRVYEKSKDDPNDALEYYARNSRVRIYRLFPTAADGTTIINGTIFVTEQNEPNLSQSILFQRCLEHLNRHAEEFGNLTKISKQFKTRLYESFMKQEVEALGQYFTPRKVVQSVIRMATIDQPSFAFHGKRICDPFCGVGGFLVEMLNLNDRMMDCYAPNGNGAIDPPFVVRGFDKGFERDDERTIILAKANMLIYLAEILFRNPQRAVEFARVFNETFTLFRDNLGTFGHIIKDEEDKFDIVMSNPPYVTSGSSIIKQEIAQTSHTKGEYPISGLGLESLALEWIVKSLRKAGRAFVIIPDGILARVHGKKLRDHLLSECFLDAIVALPVRTFFANFECTYILVLTKKNDPTQVQEHPVFTYLVANIGERLTSVEREEIENDDLPEMERLFKAYDATKNIASPTFEQHPRCKIQSIETFRTEPHWVVDRWWSREEKSALDGDGEKIATKDELDGGFRNLEIAIGEYEELSKFVEAAGPVRRLCLGDEDDFHTSIGKRVLKRELAHNGVVPVYSANVFSPMGFLDSTRIEDFENPSILWGIDGNFDFNVIPAGDVFEITDHCGALRILNPDIVPEYVLYALHKHRREEDYTRSFRASLANMRRIEIDIPVNDEGDFDVDRQREIAECFVALREKARAVENMKNWLNERIGSFLNADQWIGEEH